MIAGRVSRAAVLAAVLAACVPAVAGGAAADRSALAVADLNAQRAANGIPAGLTENTRLSHDCAAHDAYMADHHELTHTERRGHRGYSAGGAYAGRNAVLTQGSGWKNGDPYDDAPLHLDQLLAPALLSVGSADAHGYSCTTTFPGWTRPAPAALTVETYPGQGTTASTSERAAELPFTPGQLVGLRAGRVTGPYLIVFASAPGQTPFDNPAQLSDATLTGPGGPVALRTVDGATALPHGYPAHLAAYTAPGGFLIPVAPLRPASTYDASVTVGFGGLHTTYAWSFATAPLDPDSHLTQSGGRLAFRSRSKASVVVTFTSIADSGSAPPERIAPGRSVALRLAAGGWRACGTQPPLGIYAGYQRCLDVTVAAGAHVR